MGKRRQLRVQHWVACLRAEVEPPVGVNNFYNLLRVGYAHPISADTEFPWALPRLDMFVRFVEGTGTAEFEVEIVWLDAPEGMRPITTFGMLHVTFRRGEPVRDTTFRFLNVPIEGEGRYLIRLWAVKPQLPRPLGDEFITLVRQP
jgi:hypothetical protein